jgi:methylthioribose-1-phosphate isomerase
MHEVLSRSPDVSRARQSLIAEAKSIHREESEYSRKISELGAELIVDGSTVLTHCNTGPLATTGYGTALGVIVAAAQQRKNVRVLVDETRPLLQGARLTTWELDKAGVPFTLITDSMAGYFMGKGRVNCVIVGADCIAANGDTANKIGTYGVAVLAKAHEIPFYVAAPTSTIDVSKKAGRDIIIEERRPDEVTHIQGVPIAPHGVDVANPAFDITPARFINAIITERGVVRKPFVREILRVILHEGGNVGG